MKISIATSIRLLFILTLVAVSVAGQTGLIEVSSPSPKPAAITSIREINLARDYSNRQESPHWRGRQCQHARARALPEM